ncbi:MAG: hypothetical protein PF961_07575, partial [Planctomycetota bacterium]|nr:hypothetical protein [Planctomycetota bacterium]
MRVACPHCHEDITVDDAGGACPHCEGPIEPAAAGKGATTLSLAPDPDADDAEGTWVGREIASCRIVSRLGKGGMGRVYLAHHPGLN